MKSLSTVIRLLSVLVFSVWFVTGCGDGKVNADSASLATLAPLKAKQISSENADAHPLAKELVTATVSTIVSQEMAEEIKRGPHSVSAKNIAKEQSESKKTIIYSVSPGSESSSTQTTSQSLNLSRFTPRAMLLDASNLESILRPIFLISGQFSSTDTRYFSQEDKFRLGEFAYLPIPNFVLARIGGNISLSQDYIFAMRTFAGRACSNLVNAEIGKLTSTDNRLVNNADWTNRKVSASAISRFMSRLFGYDAAEGVLHSGAQELATIFNDAVAATVVGSRTKDNVMRDNYILSCVNVVTDPRTFSR